MEKWPYQGVPDKKAQKAIKRGERPDLYRDVNDSKNPADVAIKEAMNMCHEHDPKKRATARAVEAYLKEQLEKLDPGRLEKWLQQEPNKVYNVV